MADKKTKTNAQTEELSSEPEVVTSEADNTSMSNDSDAENSSSSDNEETTPDNNVNEPKPNIIFVGKNPNLVIEGKINNGMNKPIRMPKSEVQINKSTEVRRTVVNENTPDEKTIEEEVEVVKAKPFYMEAKDVATVTKLFGDLYKRYKEKGEK